MSSKYSGPSRDLMRLTMVPVYKGELPVYSSLAANSIYSHILCQHHQRYGAGSESNRALHRNAPR